MARAMSQMKWVVFAGRFQPFHHGHWEAICACMKEAPGDAAIVLGVVAPSHSPSGRDDLARSFSREAAEHHQPGRNPWDLSVRLRAALAVARVVNSFGSSQDRLLVTALPRPDYAFDTIRLWFPGERTWAIPDAGEEFDEIKETYFLARGDQVMRITCLCGVSGRELRSAYASQRRDQFRKGVPSFLWEIYAALED
jgi:hypothetical protein